MDKKPIFKKIKEAEEILGVSLSLIKKWGRKRFLSYYGQKASAVVLIATEERYKRIRKRPFIECLEWLNKATCPEDAFHIFYNAMQTICNHLGWERRV